MVDHSSPLRPLGEGVPEDAARLAAALRELFSSLGLSVRRYASRTHRNAGAVSRYLNGTRVPPWDFVTELFIEVAKQKKAPLRQEAMELIKESHRNALKVSNKRLHEVQTLQDQLEEADARVQQAAIREQVLMEGLQLREQRIAELETRHVELSARRDKEIREREGAVAELALARETDSDELARLKSEVDQLRVELQRAKESSAAAEERCRTLEERLAAAEEQAQAGREAMESDKLEEAQRSAEEARALAEELRHEIADLKAANLASSRFRSTSGAASDAGEYLLDLEERERQKAQQLAGRPAEVNIRELIRSSVKGETTQEYTLAVALAKWSTPETVREICQGLQEKGHPANTLLAHTAASMSLPQLRVLLALLLEDGKDGEDGRRGRDLVSGALYHFAYFRDAPEVVTFMRQLSEAGWAPWVNQINANCAKERKGDKLAELLRELDPDESYAMIETIVHVRRTKDIPALLLRMEALGLDAYLQRLLSRLRDLRPGEYDGLLATTELAKD
ncbi:helix-turn-helix domain-containing protein [Streptomyces erythrochromogenes]|uniref:helix-turn-helix domain-containing protein n=1 Tax=Streptomyces erythrochromogenes TaxID=285574 RepID=UPI0036847CD8